MSDHMYVSEIKCDVCGKISRLAASRETVFRSGGPRDWMLKVYLTQNMLAGIEAWHDICDECKKKPFGHVMRILMAKAPERIFPPKATDAMRKDS